MADSQVPWGLNAVNDDRTIPIAAQRFMCERAGSEATEVPGSHAIYVSNPQAVATLIETAANQCHAVSGR
jgi:hypothetical protein